MPLRAHFPVPPAALRIPDPHHRPVRRIRANLHLRGTIEVSPSPDPSEVISGSGSALRVVPSCTVALIAGGIGSSANAGGSGARYAGRWLPLTSFSCVRIVGGVFRSIREIYIKHQMSRRNFEKESGLELRCLEVFLLLCLGRRRLCSPSSLHSARGSVRAFPLAYRIRAVRPALAKFTSSSLALLSLSHQLTDATFITSQVTLRFISTIL